MINGVSQYLSRLAVAYGDAHSNHGYDDGFACNNDALHNLKKER